jgi:glycosyltransferase involved in cell wall biosynthesis
MIKVALIARSTLFTIKGGDTTQVVNTAAELKKTGVDATVFKANEKINYNEFDLLHLFNIVRPADHLYHIRKSHKPYAVSTIYLDYSAFDHNGRPKFYSLLFKTAGKQGAEYLKNLFRFVKNQDKLVSPEYLLGHLRAIRKVVQQSNLLLPNSRSEYERLKNDTGIKTEYEIIPNGIDLEIFGKLPKIQRHDKVLCVAQVYGMKNQHRLIEACSQLNLSLDIIGKTPPNHVKYMDYCKSIASKKINFYDFMPQKDLLAFYASSKVHALPSWFETTGLSSLEAGAMGCNLVVGTGGDTKEYFKSEVEYCYAGDLKSIVTAIDKAMNRPLNNKLRDLILSEYTWQKAAEKTKKAYERVLDEKR